MLAADNGEVLTAHAIEGVLPISTYCKIKIHLWG